MRKAKSDVFEERVHGISQDGESFINKNKKSDALLRSAGMHMNLARHNCKSTRDVAHTSTGASSEIQVYRSEEDEFYAKNFGTHFRRRIRKVHRICLRHHVVKACSGDNCAQNFCCNLDKELAQGHGLIS